MSDVIASGRYTRALFELAKESGCLEEIDAGLHALVKILGEQPKIRLLIANPTLTQDQKVDLALKTLTDGRPGLLERFLRVLIDKKRFEILPEVQKLFHATFEKIKGLQEVEMISAVPLSPGFREKLSALLKKKLRSEIRLIPSTDRGLLGGFVLRFGGKEIDCSFKNRLHEIREKLLTESDMS